MAVGAPSAVTPLSQSTFSFVPQELNLDEVWPALPGWKRPVRSAANTDPLHDANLTLHDANLPLQDASQDASNQDATGPRSLAGPGDQQLAISSGPRSLAGPGMIQSIGNDSVNDSVNDSTLTTSTQLKPHTQPPRPQQQPTQPWINDTNDETLPLFLSRVSSSSCC